MRHECSQWWILLVYIRTRSLYVYTVSCLCSLATALDQAYSGGCPMTWSQSQWIFLQERKNSPPRFFLNRSRLVQIDTNFLENASKQSKELNVILVDDLIKSITMYYAVFEHILRFTTIAFHSICIGYNTPAEPKPNWSGLVQGSRDQCRTVLITLFINLVLQQVKQKEKRWPNSGESLSLDSEAESLNCSQGYKDRPKEVD